MADQKDSPGQDEQISRPRFQVRPTKQARRDCKDLFRSVRETLWVISQLKLLMHWPLDERQQQQLGSDLDFTKVHDRGEAFFELRLDDARLHQKNLRVFFWVDDGHRTIWVIHGYWKKTNRLDEAVKTRVARRIKALKSGISDGRVP
jgi:phage-related protein